MKDLLIHESAAVGGARLGAAQSFLPLPFPADGGPVVMPEILPPPYEHLPVEPIRPPVFY